jgi:hypothetical protein
VSVGLGSWCYCRGSRRWSIDANGYDRDLFSTAVSESQRRQLIVNTKPRQAKAEGFDHVFTVEMNGDRITGSFRSAGFRARRDL